MMEKQKHTPGPWKAHTFAPEIGIGHYVTAGIQDSIPICSTDRCDLASTADAHLIAAAPNLLEACRKLRRQLDDLQVAIIDQNLTDRFIDDSINMMSEGKTTLGMADAAIAKAEGKH
jgi:hypothetical protein